MTTAKNSVNGKRRHSFSWDQLRHIINKCGNEKYIKIKKGLKTEITGTSQ